MLYFLFPLQYVLAIYHYNFIIPYNFKKHLDTRKMMCGCRYTSSKNKLKILLEIYNFPSTFNSNHRRILYFIPVMCVIILPKYPFHI